MHGSASLRIPIGIGRPVFYTLVLIRILNGEQVPVVAPADLVRILLGQFLVPDRASRDANAGLCHPGGASFRPLLAGRPDVALPALVAALAIWAGGTVCIPWRVDIAAVITVLPATTNSPRCETDSPRKCRCQKCDSIQEQGDSDL
jgi:hypothetical protein